jgi:hypothetical protein
MSQTTTSLRWESAMEDHERSRHQSSTEMESRHSHDVLERLQVARLSSGEVVGR